MRSYGRITTKRRAVAGYTAIPKSVSGGGGISPWFSNVAAFVQGVQGTLVAATLASECTSLSVELEAQAATGTGTAAISTSIAGGVINLTSGATASSFRIARNKNGKTEPVVSNLQSAKYAIATRSKVVATNATSMLYMCGLSDETTADLFLGQKTSVSGTNWVLSVGVGPTTLDTGVAFDTSADHTLVIIADGTNLRGYIGAADGTAITAAGATLAQNLAPSAAGAIRLASFNQGTASNCACSVDSILVLTERAA